MTNATYTTTATPQFKITCHADLVINGTADNLVVIDIDDNSPATRIDRQDEVIKIVAAGDCDIACPIGSQISIEHASGDLRVLQVKGGIAINTINGDAALHDVGPTAIKAVQGDLSLRDADGDVGIDVIRGDAKLKRVSGNVAISKVAGDLVINDLAGGLSVNMVGGDASLQASLIAGQSYAVKTGGDLIWRIEGGGGQFAFNCKGDLRVRLPLTNWAGNDHSATGTYGDGSAQVALVANGDLLVLPASTGAPFDPDVLSEQVEAMIESAMTQFESQMSRVQRDLEQQFGKQAEKAAERAARSAERSAAHAKRRAERAAGSWGGAAGRPAAPPPPTSEPVTDQERLLILKMVEEGKITADQAAQLLSALEG